MLRLWKFGGVTVGAGLLIGFGVVGWMATHRSSDGSVAAVKPGTVGGLNLSSGSSVDTGSSSLSGGSTPIPTPGLVVTNNGNQGGVLGTSTGDQSGGGAPQSGNSSSSGNGGLLDPSQFTQYEQYKDSSTVLYQDVKVGSGAPVAKGSAVTVQYRGWLTNGQEFDESYARGKPFTFTEGAGTVIAGWAEGVYGMKAGGQRRLIVPATLGYGMDAHGAIPANSMLIFDIEVLSVQ